MLLDWIANLHISIFWLFYQFYFFFSFKSKTHSFCSEHRATFWFENETNTFVFMVVKSKSSNMINGIRRFVGTWNNVKKKFIPKNPCHQKISNVTRATWVITHVLNVSTAGNNILYYFSSNNKLTCIKFNSKL